MVLYRLQRKYYNESKLKMINMEDMVMASIKYLEDRIAGAKANIVKLNAKLDRIYKAKDTNWEVNPYYYNESDLKRAEKDLETAKANLAKYEAQLTEEKEKESDLPELFSQFRANLVKEWDADDKLRRSSLKEEYKAMQEADTSRCQMDSYRAFIKKYKYQGYQFMSISDEEIHRDNVRATDKLIKNLWTRVKDITGDVTENHLYLTNGNGWEGLVIAGYIKGAKGNAVVDTILAGGYNIQRLHIRTLVHAR